MNKFAGTRQRIAHLSIWMLICLFGTNVAATDWTGAGIGGLWSDAGNWSGGVPVDGSSVVFGGAGSDSIDNLTTLSLTAFNFAPAVLPRHDTHVAVGASLFLTGAGIINASLFSSSGVNRQQFFADAGGLITFQNNATIGGNLPVDLNAQGGTTLGGSGGRVVFAGFTSASNATDLVRTGLRALGATVAGASGGELRFQDDAKMGPTASFAVNAGTVTGAAGGTAIFEGRSVASGSAANLTDDGLGGSVIFRANAVADSSISLQNFGAVVSGAGAAAVTQFRDDGALGGFVENMAGTGAGFAGGHLEFHERARFDGTLPAPIVGNVVITNDGALAVGAESGHTTFFDDSQTVGANTVINNNAQSEGAQAGAMGGFTEFLGRSHAGQSAINNTGATTGATGALSDSGRTFFRENSSAENAIITAGGGSLLNGSVGGRIEFSGASTAANTTLIASSGSGGGLGGNIIFSETASGGNANVTVGAGGVYDQSALTTSGTTLGFIDGAGDFFLGGKTLSVGSSNASTTVAGVIQDGGQAGGTGGALTKVGTGTLTLFGANTYSGSTNINEGRLLVIGTLANGAVTVASGATLTGNGTVGGDVTVTAGGILAPGVNVGALSLGALNLNTGSHLAFQLGQPDVVGGAFNDRLVVARDLTLGGILDVTNSGAFGLGAYRLIDYGGALTNNGMSIGTVPAGFVASDLTVQTSVAKQVNLLVGGPAAVLLWDGAQLSPNGAVDGGSGAWNNSATNWTNASGSVNLPWKGTFGVFTGAAGAVNVTENIATTGMQFVTTGYAIGADPGAAITLNGATNFRVDPGATATINAPLTGAGSLTKLDTGTLTLGGDNSYTGGTTVSGGTLQVTNTNGLGLGAGPVIVKTADSGALEFLSAASAGSNSITNEGGSFGIVAFTRFFASATAANATIVNQANFNAGSGGGVTAFFASSSAGRAVIDNLGGLFAAGPSGIGGGDLGFNDNSTAANSQIFNRGGQAANAGSGQTLFNGSSTAGSAFILNRSATAVGASAGRTRFFATTSAGAAKISNEGSFLSRADSGFTQFSDFSSAGAATIINEASTVSGAALGGFTEFFSGASAGTATFINQGSGVGGGVAAGFVLFTPGTTAANATITNQGGAAAGAAGGKTNFEDGASAGNGAFDNLAGTVVGANSGQTQFNGIATTAGNARITNEGAQFSGQIGGVTQFSGTATAASATFVNEAGLGNVGAFGGFTIFSDASTAGAATFTNHAASSTGAGGTTEFFGTSNAGTATLISDGSAVDGAGSGNTQFHDSSSALKATLTASAGIGTAPGGAIVFFDTSDGGQARAVIAGGGGTSPGGLDISHLTNAGMSIGSIEGGGIVSLGRRNLTVGTNNLNTDFSGIIRDGGFVNETGGSLTKVGTGTLILDGANTFTGRTDILQGLLRVNGSLAGGAFVRNATLGGNGTIAGGVTVGPGGIVNPGASPGRLTVLGDYTQATDSMLVIEIGGTSPGLFDVLDVSGKISLGGTLKIQLVNNFTPGATDTFAFLLGSAFAGSFDKFILPTFGNGQTFYLNFGANGITAAVAPVPLPAAIWLFGSALGGFGFLRRRAA